MSKGGHCLSIRNSTLLNWEKELGMKEKEYTTDFLVVEENTRLKEKNKLPWQQRSSIILFLWSRKYW